VLQAAWNRSKKLLVVSARLKQDMQHPAWLRFADGRVTQWGTFQKFFEQSELREWIDATVVGMMLFGPAFSASRAVW
jgi:hypothetical protein